jgi:hypothetical protein
VSEARVLHVQEQRVAEEARGDYLRAAAARQAACGAAGVHCWVFEHDTEAGRFVEFVEARDASALEQALSAAGVESAAGSRWRSVALG